MEEDRINNIKDILGIGDEINENGVVDQINNKKSGKGSVQIEETEDENGMQRKVVRDLGNGKKSVEITRVMKNHHNGQSIFYIFKNILY